MFYTLLYKFAPDSLSVNVILIICTAIYAVLHYIIFNGIVKLPTFIMKYSYIFYGILFVDLTVFMYLYKKEFNKILSQLDAKTQQLDDIIQKNVSLNKSHFDDTDELEQESNQMNNRINPNMMQQNMMMQQGMMQNMINQQMNNNINGMNQGMMQRMNQGINQQMMQRINPQNNQQTNNVINQEVNQQNNQQIQKRQMIIQQKQINEQEQENNEQNEEDQENIIIEKDNNEQPITKDTIINNQSDDEISETKNEASNEANNEANNETIDSEEIDGESINKN